MSWDSEILGRTGEGAVYRVGKRGTMKSRSEGENASLKECS